MLIVSGELQLIFFTRICVHLVRVSFLNEVLKIKNMNGIKNKRW